MLLAGGGLVVVAALWWWSGSLLDHAHPIDPQEIREAVQTYCRERRALGIPLPPTVTSRELVKAGYLRPEAVRGFGSAEVVFSLKVDNRNPAAVLMEARMPDGTRVGAFGDGSLQTLDAPATSR
jgi:hypothetical protein